MKRTSSRGRSTIIALEVLALAAASLFWMGGLTGTRAAEPGADAPYTAADDPGSRTLLGLYSDDFPAQVYGKVDLGERTWVRNQKIQMRWIDVEAKRDVYVWDKYDDQIESCLANGSDSIMLLLHGPVPYWAQDSQYGEYASKAPPRDMGYWHEFCAKVAERYGSVVSFYEVWNEPSLDVDSPSAAFWDVRFFGAQVETDYLPMVQSAYDAIKGIDSQSCIVVGSLISGLTSSPDEGFDLYRALFDDVNRPGQDVSMSIHSSQGIIAERPMYFNYQGKWTGGHDVVGATAPSSLWLFAEGYTGEGFDEWLCLQNPNDTSVTAEVTYLFADGSAPLIKDYPLGAESRFTIKVNDEVGAGRDVSIKVESTEGDIVAERPMYFNYAGAWTGGHNVLGANAAEPQWYFAEGYTGEGFDEWLCLMNPNPASVNAKVTYIFADGAAPLIRTYPINGNSRYTVNVNQQVGAGRELSLKVESTEGDIVAERPMYFAYRDVWTGGHDVVGCPTPGSSFYFAEGYTGEGFDEWLCLMNPNATAAKAEVTYIYSDGTSPRTVTHDLAANRRFTINVNEEAGRGKEVSITVTSTGGDIVAERPMYFNYRGTITGGHNVIGASAPSQDWYFAEGCAGYGIEEWLCLQNPNAGAATVDITYMMKGGHTLTRQVVVPGKSRQTLNVNTVLGLSASCDEVAVHPYRQPEDWGYFYNNIVQALASVGCYRELVATEIGWPNYSCNPNYPVEDKEAEQAAALGDQGLGTLWAYGCRKVWIYKDVDEDPGMSWDYNFYGLFDYTGYPHPAWLEYKYWQTTLPDYADLPSSLP